MADEKKNEENSWQTKEWKDLKDSVEGITAVHLRDLLTNKDSKARNDAFQVEYKDIRLDFSRQQLTLQVFSKLLALAKKRNLEDKIKSMFNGERINTTEDRAVLHVALRKSINKVADENINAEVQEVSKVLDQIKTFSEKIRNGELKGYTGKPITNIISIGIGGSYLGAEFVFEALKTDPIAYDNAKGRQLKFYANIDPIGFLRASEGLDAENTLAIVVSKSFGTRETLMNAGLIRTWLIESFKGDEKCLKNHFVAVTSNSEKAQKAFNVDPANVFNFWDWVGGRYSVCSAVGMLPLSLHYGYDVMENFLKGANDIDQHFLNTPLEKNIPILLGLIGVWNSSFLGYSCRGLIPYCESLTRFAAHIQQTDMESNGKRVSINGLPMGIECGEIDFGEPGTNAQHSFFQLIHQGRVIPVDFIAFTKSQLSEFNNKFSKEMLKLILSNQDELMSNFFAQADALAFGKTAAEVQKDNVPKSLIEHKVFTGNRPSNLLLFNGHLDAFKCGQLLSIYEHRTAVQGWIWGVNSFDQWGVELGKVLGTKVRNSIDNFRLKKEKIDDSYSSATQDMISYYLNKSS